MPRAWPASRPPRCAAWSARWRARAWPGAASPACWRRCGRITGTLLDAGCLLADPTAGIAAPKSPRRLPATLDADHLARLLDFAGEDPLARRDRALFELLYSSGLRLAEVVALDRADLDLADASARVTGKGNKTRIVPVGSRARDALS